MKKVATDVYSFTDIPYDMTDRQNEQMWQPIVYVVLRTLVGGLVEGVM